MLIRTVTTKFTPLVQKTLSRSLATKISNTTSKGKQRHKFNDNGRSFLLEMLMAIGVSGITAASVTAMDARRKSHYPQPPTMVPAPSVNIADQPRINSPPPRPDLPIYTREEVAEHCDKDSLWYTFRGAVYDLTRFYEGHPGGAPVGYPSHGHVLPKLPQRVSLICTTNIHLLSSVY
jgi:hypothetical protein